MRLILLIISLGAALITAAQRDSTAVSIQILANNLSEDFSVVSSKSDELMLIIYEFESDSGVLKDPVFVKNYFFNENKKRKIDEWKVIQADSDYIFFLVEMDSDRTIYQLDPVFRIYFSEITKAFDNRNYLAIEKFLGDEDLLGYSEFSIPSTHQLQGVYKLDKFDYTVTFQE